MFAQVEAVVCPVAYCLAMASFTRPPAVNCTNYSCRSHSAWLAGAAPVDRPFSRRRPLLHTARPEAAPCTCSAQQAAAAPLTAEESAGKVRAAVTRRIKQLARAGRPRDAVAELAQMARLGVQPDTQAATALVDACARNGKMDMAQSVFDEMFGEFLQPDEVTFAVMVRGYGEGDPPQWAAISSLLNTMDSKYNLRPTTALYNALLEICARTKDEERGYEIIQRMQASGVAPDEFTTEAVRQRRGLRSALKRAYADAF